MPTQENPDEFWDLLGLVSWYSLMRWEGGGGLGMAIGNWNRMNINAKFWCRLPPWEDPTITNLGRILITILVVTACRPVQGQVWSTIYREICELLPPWWDLPATNTNLQRNVVTNTRIAIASLWEFTMSLNSLIFCLNLLKNAKMKWRQHIHLNYCRKNLSIPRFSILDDGIDVLVKW